MNVRSITRAAAVGCEALLAEAIEHDAAWLALSDAWLALGDVRVLGDRAGVDWRDREGLLAAALVLLQYAGASQSVRDAVEAECVEAMSGRMRP